MIVGKDDITLKYDSEKGRQYIYDTIYEHDQDQDELPKKFHMAGNEHYSLKESLPVMLSIVSLQKYEIKSFIQNYYDYYEIEKLDSYPKPDEWLKQTNKTP